MDAEDLDAMLAEFEEDSATHEPPVIRTWDAVIRENSAKFHKWHPFWHEKLHKYGFSTLWHYANMIYGFDPIAFERDWVKRYPIEKNTAFRDALLTQLGEDGPSVVAMIDDLIKFPEMPDDGKPKSC